VPSGWRSMQGTVPPAGRQVRPGAAPLHGSLDGRLSRDPRGAAAVAGLPGGRSHLPAGGSLQAAPRLAPHEGHPDVHPSRADRPPTESPAPDAAPAARCEESTAARRALQRAHPAGEEAPHAAVATDPRRPRAVADAAAPRVAPDGAVARAGRNAAAVPRAHRPEEPAGHQVLSLARAREAPDVGVAQRAAESPLADAPRGPRRRPAGPARRVPAPAGARPAAATAPPPTTRSGRRPGGVPCDREVPASRPPGAPGSVRAAVGRACSRGRDSRASAARAARRARDSGAGPRWVRDGSASRRPGRSRPVERRRWRCEPWCCGRRSPGSH